MIRKAATFSMTLLLLATNHGLAAGQTIVPSILTIRVENQVEYVQDASDPSKFASIPDITTPVGSQNNFGVVTLIGDIVSVNDQPAKGTYVGRTRLLLLRPAPTPGQAIADAPRTAIREVIFEILKSDGTPIGSIVGLGFSGGAPPPGAPLAQRGGSWAIIGGTGAFLGARGEFGGAQTPGSGNIARMASMSEDPANRRLNGGGTQPFVLTVIPLSAPQITAIFGVPAVSHSEDSSLVTVSTPAAPGEVLSLRATGLGPTIPGIDPGQVFPSSPPVVVNSPVEVKLNGKSAEVLSAVGVPGTLSGYEVRFRVPADTPRGPAKIQLGAAWIWGETVSIAIE
jgi:hypothetical protein